jgi:predicted glycosyltransferase involved in capsule biosynthesis
MDITNYINQKNKCYVFNLTKSKTILNELNLIDYPNSNKYENTIENIFSDKDLVIFIIDSHEVKNKTIFKIASKLNNVLVYIIDDIYTQNNETQCNNIFISYGYKYQGKCNNDKVLIFIYDIAEYKDNPDWLNNKNWANPELWEK